MVKQAAHSPNGASWVAQGERTREPWEMEFFLVLPSCLTPRAEGAYAGLSASSGAHRGMCESFGAVFARRCALGQWRQARWKSSEKHVVPGFAAYRSPWATQDALLGLWVCGSTRGRGGITFCTGHFAAQTDGVPFSIRRSIRIMRRGFLVMWISRSCLRRRYEVRLTP